ncbi:MAG: hypothetical protein ACJ72N_01105 [Labedaea sp.]
MNTRLRDLARDPAVIDRLVTEATDDWLGFFVVYGVLRKASGATMGLAEFADAAIPVLRVLMTEHGVKPGDLDGKPPVFTPWPTSVEDSLARIEREIHALDHPPLSDEICWFSAE